MEWISVKDRLPENDDEVLVLVSGRPRENITLTLAPYVAQFWKGDYPGDDEWDIEGWPDCWNEPEIEYWMPIPDPPKETMNFEDWLRQKTREDENREDEEANEW